MKATFMIFIDSTYMLDINMHIDYRLYCVLKVQYMTKIKAFLVVHTTLMR